MSNTNPFLLSRRSVLKSAGAGFGYLALAGLLGQQATKLLAAEKSPIKPLASKQPHFKSKAKRVIFLFMEGAMSQHDTFDYKPILEKNDGSLRVASEPGKGSAFTVRLPAALTEEAAP